MNKNMPTVLITLMIVLATPCWGQADTATQTSNHSSANAAAISGAFGITLGTEFEQSTVASVVEKQPITYSAAGGQQLNGLQIKFMPTDQDKRFQHYSIKTNAQGVIYEIEAEYSLAVEPAMGKKFGQPKNARQIRSNCKDAVKSLAAELQQQYGKPRGKGWDGEWFNFRQLSSSTDRSINLYANQCRTGIYRIIYTDKKAKQGTAL